LGVATAFDGQGVGTQLLNFIKALCFDSNPCNCRFLVVDAYNKPEILNFYQKNGFITVFSTEEQEREYKRLDSSFALRTRYMYYDMIYFKNEIATP
jgi:ribosomal protein S18 acetylase RimI-like enzyme